MKGDIEMLIRLGRVMVEDGGRVGVVEDTLDFTERLNNLKASFNKLGIEVALNEDRE